MKEFRFNNWITVINTVNKTIKISLKSWQPHYSIFPLSMLCSQLVSVLVVCERVGGGDDRFVRFWHSATQQLDNNKRAFNSDTCCFANHLVYIPISWTARDLRRPDMWKSRRLLEPKLCLWAWWCFQSFDESLVRIRLRRYEEDKKHCWVCRSR